MFVFVCKKYTINYFHMKILIQIWFQLGLFGESGKTAKKLESLYSKAVKGLGTY